MPPITLCRRCRHYAAGNMPLLLTLSLPLDIAPLEPPPRHGGLPMPPSRRRRCHFAARRSVFTRHAR